MDTLPRLPSPIAVRVESGPLGPWGPFSNLTARGDKVSLSFLPPTCDHAKGLEGGVCARSNKGRELEAGNIIPVPCLQCLDCGGWPRNSAAVAAFVPDFRNPAMTRNRLVSRVRWSSLSTRFDTTCAVLNVWWHPSAELSDEQEVLLPVAYCIAVRSANHATTSVRFSIRAPDS